MDFIPDCNVHQEIIFTEAATKKLMKHDLHLNEQYVKKKMYKENFWTFFSRCQPNDDSISIMTLPKETLNIIQEQMEAQRGRL